jgi:hypothetical protein
MRSTNGLYRIANDQEAAMRGILFPAILAAAGYLGVTHTDKVVDLYRAAYPSDPQKSQALERCAALNPNFNRLDSADRAYCYSDGYGTRPTTTVLGPAPSPSYDFSPSHLPKDDIRRQQANDAYAAPPALPAPATPVMAGPVTVQPEPSVTKPVSPTGHTTDPHHTRRHQVSQLPPYQTR